MGGRSPLMDVGSYSWLFGRREEMAMGEAQGAVSGEVCVRGHINDVLLGPRGRAPLKNRLVKGKWFFTSESSSPLQGGASAPGTTVKGTVIPKRNRPSAETKAARNDSLCTATGNSESQTPCLFVLGCSTSISSEDTTVDRQARQKTIHIGHCLLPESLPSLAWARLPVKQHPSYKAFYHLSGIHSTGREVPATSSTYSFSFPSPSAAGLLSGRFPLRFHEWFDCSSFLDTTRRSPIATKLLAELCAHK